MTVDISGKKFAFVGVGVMGGAILSAFLSSKGVEPQAVTAVAEDASHIDGLKQRFPGISVTTDALGAVGAADVMVVAVKPKDVPAVLTSVKKAFVPQLENENEPRKMVLTVAAGLPTSFYEKRLGPVPVVRAMPNTPAQIGLGMTAISAGAEARADEMALAERILSASGEVITVAEKDQDAVSAISGSGPAYIFAVIDAMAEAGVMLGLRRDVAAKLAAQTVLGSGTMAMQGLEATPVVPPATLREQVTSPGGTTARALFELDKAGLRAGFIAAAQAAWDKSRELGSTEE
ncbi:MAG: pyrroline-5-carboxylate reductase [Bifidobacteriaceae bacterium]|nr:pyrroline-5-carboxylate reductase [Bifidobacteriaceae bacterium]MCI1979107.1 pyrroline-5-carboxylate reductase [Bifidobacteriaceae bacterium]